MILTRLPSRFKRYSDACFCSPSMLVVPAQSLPYGSHLASLNLRLSCMSFGCLIFSKLSSRR
uniref:YvrF protein n=1 Tax=Bacillus subtilis TaxID=1423 RepID=O52860_BACIU|nr:YvrF protein [Bacillus subtilis] [Bacillus subtilis subsp. subtilis str. 168]